ncbi:MAG: tetratricopeptide repeat protein [Methanothrix sp.]
MWNKINWKGIKAYRRDYNLAFIFIVLSLFFVVILILIYLNIIVAGISSLSLIDVISISIGLIGLDMAVWSIRSTTISFNEIQADYWNTRGLDEEKRKEYHDAHQAYDKAIGIDPQSMKFSINKSNALLDQGRRYREKSILIEALKTIDVAIGHGPKYPATLRKNTSKEKKAEQEYANALKTRCDILLELANVSRKDDGVYTSPQTNYQFAHLHFIDQLPDCDLLKGHFSIDAHPTSQILRTCAIRASNESIDKYHEKNSERPGAYVSKGNALQSTGRYDDAIRAYEDAIELWEEIGRDPNCAIAWGGKGNALLDKGKSFSAESNREAAVKYYRNAVEAYDRAIELKPDFANIWLYKGNALMAQKKYDEAIHAYDKAIEFEPLLSDAWNQRGNVLIRQAKHVHAMIPSNVGWIWSNTSDVISIQRDYYYHEALKSYSMAIDINPFDKIPWDNKGNVLTYLGKYDDAIQAHDKAIMLDPQYALAQCNKGFTFLHQGKYDEAIQACDKAIELDPKFAESWNNKGKALKALGRITEAEAAFAKANKLGHEG